MEFTRLRLIAGDGQDGSVALIRLVSGQTAVVRLPDLTPILIWDECKNSLVLNSKNVDGDSALKLSQLSDITLDLGLDDTSLLDIIGNNMMPRISMLKDIPIEPLVLDGCHNQLSLNSRNVELDSGVGLDNNSNIMLGGIVLSDSLFKAVANNIMPRGFLPVSMPIIWNECFGNLVLSSRNTELDSGIDLDGQLNVMLSSVVDENSKLEMTGNVVMPGSEYIQPAIIDPLVFRECSNDVVLNSHRHNLDASLMMDENYNLMIDPSGEGDSLLEQDGNNFMPLTQHNL